MNIYRNEKIIKRNARIAQFATLGGLAVLAGGMFISFRYPEQFAISLGALLVGFILSQLGIFYSNRWGRRPRPDELIDQALKGMDRKFAIYHYVTPVSHLLVGPSGIWILIPYYQRGTVTFAKGRWQQKGGNLYLKIFAQEGLGRPDLEVTSETSSLQSYLQKILPDEEIPDAQVALVFTNPKVNIDIPEDEQPPAETVSIKELKEVIRKTGKGKGLTMDKVKLIQGALPDLPAVESSK
jgi:hypothetical protein